MKNLLKLLIVLIGLFFVNYMVYPQLQEPYKILTIPGRIEAEDFDKGGEGISYHDNNTRDGDCSRIADVLADYSVDSVKVDLLSGGDEDNTCIIGFNGGGEWQEYTIDSITPGTYDISARLSVPTGEKDGGTIKFHINDSLIGELTFGPGLGWDKYFNEIYTIRNVKLKGGKNKVFKVLLAKYGGGAICNMNWYEFTLQGATRVSEVLSGNSIHVYPTIVYDELNIEADKQISSVELYNVTGNKVLNFNDLKNNSLNIGQLSSGIYFVKITINEKFMLKKIIKR